MDSNNVKEIYGIEEEKVIDKNVYDFLWEWNCVEKEERLKRNVNLTVITESALKSNLYGLGQPAN